MAEQQPNLPLTPISETDIEPINHLTPQDILTLGQEYIRSSFEAASLGKTLDERPIEADADIAENLHWQSGYSSAYRKILVSLGQSSLVAKIDLGIQKIFPGNKG